MERQQKSQFSECFFRELKYQSIGQNDKAWFSLILTMSKSQRARIAR